MTDSPNTQMPDAYLSGINWSAGPYHGVRPGPDALDKVGNHRYVLTAPEGTVKVGEILNLELDDYVPFPRLKTIALRTLMFSENLHDFVLDRFVLTDIEKTYGHSPLAKVETYLGTDKWLVRVFGIHYGENRHDR